MLIFGKHIQPDSDEANNARRQRDLDSDQGRLFPLCRGAEERTEDCRFEVHLSKLSCVISVRLLSSGTVHGHDPTGGPADTARAQLSGYTKRDDLFYFEAHFAIDSASEEDRFRADITTLADELTRRRYARTIVFITTHSVKQSGMLFIGKDKIVEVNQFMELFFGGAMSQVMHRATVFFLTCGGLVRNPDSFAGLQQSVTKYHLRLWAFTAFAFQPHVINDFVLAYCKAVFIRDTKLARIGDVFAALGWSVGLHTDLVYLSPAVSGDHIACIQRYVWSHKERKPWGHCLPMQCPWCSCIRNWSDPVSNGPTLVFTCKSNIGRCSPRGYRFACSPEPGYQFVHHGASDNGKWLVYKK
ncbi:hypothetical protein BJ138DRAFT_1106472 [Hygrophoropsis aurantiaca]|uniref:Uncharacterized protein n=1 Tax=Hygrophoropsis aurantiaca TaxID=72124 RepID=A0ACB7ZUV4_9AGAM|nr:hypothetical protein BJ138DRAFT_1106472 [Hygrophoropsis aurantiaca]